MPSTVLLKKIPGTKNLNPLLQRRLIIYVLRKYLVLINTVRLKVILIECVLILQKFLFIVHLCKIRHCSFLFSLPFLKVAMIKKCKCYSIVYFRGPFRGPFFYVPPVFLWKINRELEKFSPFSKLEVKHI